MPFHRHWVNANRGSSGSFQNPNASHHVLKIQETVPLCNLGCVALQIPPIPNIFALRSYMPKLGLKKSRGGCTNCKRRRVKCDERQPCRNCLRRRERCSLDTGAVICDSSLPFLHRLGNALTTSAGEWAMELYVMHHYTAEAAFSLSDDRQLQHIWKDEAALLAIHHPFLMHGLLSLSALHLAHLNPCANEGYMQLHKKHQKLALSGIHGVLLRITRSNCDAILLCASVASITSIFEFSMGYENCDRPSICAKIAELFVVTRGAGIVSQAGLDWIEEGPLKPISKANLLSLPDTYSLPIETKTKLQDLKAFVLDHCRQPNQTTALEAAWDLLNQLYTKVCFAAGTRRMEPGFIIQFLATVPSEFVTMIQEGEDAALVLFAYFTALSTGVKGKWFCNENLGRVGIELVRQVIDQRFHPWLEWPCQKLKYGFAATASLQSSPWTVTPNSEFVL